MFRAMPEKRVVVSDIHFIQGCGQFLLPCSLKSFSSKTKLAENSIEHNQQNSLSSQMAVPGPARFFFLLILYIARAKSCFLVASHDNWAIGVSESRFLTCEKKVNVM